VGSNRVGAHARIAVRVAGRSARFLAHDSDDDTSDTDANTNDATDAQ
jgi:hypothetical protein